MSTTKQKEPARRNSKKSTKAASVKTRGASVAKKTSGLSTAKKNDLPDSSFAFPKERKEPLTDAKHVRNAIARFDQVEGVSDADRDRAWRRVKSAAKKFGVYVAESSWRELGKSSTRGS
jgi:hypothetical protein